MCTPLLALLALAAQNDGGYSFVGQPDSMLGGGVGWTEDLNGDGVADLLVGAYGPNAVSDSSGMVEVRSGADGSLIRRDYGPDGSHLGKFLVGMPDVDGDGFGDYAAGVAGWGSLGTAESGLLVYSGATGAEIWRFEGRVTGEELGERMHSFPDLNGDGVDDLLVSGSNTPDGSGGSLFRGGEMLILSGVDGSILREQIGGVWAENFATAIGLAGDLNLDGYEDYIAGSYNKGPWGTVEVFSGADGSLLWSIQGSVNTGDIGQFVTSTGDVNGDGLPDIVTSMSFYGNGLQCYSGADGSPLWTEPIERPAVRVSYNISVHRVGDYNQDGISEIGGTIGYIGDPQFLRLVDGSNGETLEILGMRRVSGMPDSFAEDFTGLPDINGDGLDDLLIGRRDFAVRPIIFPTGYVYNEDGEAFVQYMRPFLTSSASELSASGGANVVMDIDFPASEAGRPYTMLMSFAGRYDAILGGNRKYAPMERDLLFDRMESGYIPSLGNGFQGTLDANGDATTQMLQGSYLSGFVGRRLRCAAVSHNGFPLDPGLISNAVVLDITP
ncbi:MAG: FG-GAP repeat domain-containing protein [Planctomycetota bacterium]